MILIVQIESTSWTFQLILAFTTLELWGYPRTRVVLATVISGETPLLTKHIHGLYMG